MRIPAVTEYIAVIAISLALGIGASLADRSGDPTSIIDLFEYLSGGTGPVACPCDQETAAP